MQQHWAYVGLLVDVAYSLIEIARSDFVNAHRKIRFSQGILAIYTVSAYNGITCDNDDKH